MEGLPRAVALTLAVLFGSGAVAGCAQTPARCPRPAERTVPVAGGAAAGGVFPVFDRQGQLGLAPPAPATAVSCGAAGAPVRRTTWVREPRVEEIQCSGEAGGERFLVGFGPAGEERWRRRLSFASGAHRIAEWVTGAGAGALVLSDLAVLSPASGEVLFPAPAHPIRGEERAVPTYALQGRALYLSEGAFLIFDAEVTLAKHRGGLYRLDPRSGRRDLLLPVTAPLLGGAWQVEDMALDPDRRHLYLAQRLARRGPGAVSFTVFDLAERRVLCLDVAAEGRWVREPKLVLGDDGSVGLSFLDEGARTAELRVYRRNP